MKNIYLLSFLFCVNLLLAQNQNANWAISGNGGLDFLPGPPNAAFSSMQNDNLAAASVSDQDGNLLFYTDGLTVWDRNHAIMPNGTGLLGFGGDFSQNVVIIPNPADINRYFIVSISIGQLIFGPPRGLLYSEVDMSVGNGIVVAGSVNTPLRDFNNDPIDVNHPLNFGKITTARHANGLDYWLLVDLGGMIIPYLVDHEGFHISQFTPSPLPAANVKPINNFELSSGMGPMKVSWDNSRILIGYAATTDGIDPDVNVGGRLFVGLFDDATGLISNFDEIEDPNVLGFGMAGAEFSPDGNTVHRVYEGTMVSGTVIPVPVGDKIRWEVGPTETLDTADGRILQIGLDGRIYYSNTDYSAAFPTFIGVINNPNSIPYAIVDNSVDAGTSDVGGTQLPTWVQWQGCVRTLVSSAFFTSSLEVERAHWIRSQDVFSGSSTIGIYHAGDFVELNPGFETTKNSGFTAYIEGCSENFVYRMGESKKQVIVHHSENRSEVINGLTVSPNPSSSIVTISNLNQKLLTVTILSIDGKMVSSQNVNENSVSIDVSNLANGIYIISTQMKDGSISSKKLIKN